MITRFPGQGPTDWNYDDERESWQAVPHPERPIERIAQSLGYYQNEDEDLTRFIAISPILQDEIRNALRAAPRPINPVLLTAGGDSQPSISFLIPGDELHKRTQYIPCIAVSLQEEERTRNGTVRIDAGLLHSTDLIHVPLQVRSSYEHFNKELCSILENAFRVIRECGESGLTLKAIGGTSVYCVDGELTRFDDTTKRKLLMMMFARHWNTGFTAERRNALLIQFGVAAENSPGRGTIDTQRKKMLLSTELHDRDDRSGWLTAV